MTGDPHDRLRTLERLAESHYDAMYETRSPTGEYANCKDAFRDAIVIAREVGDEAAATRLEARLAHVKAVFRSQFT